MCTMTKMTTECCRDPHYACCRLASLRPAWSSRRAHTLSPSSRGCHRRGRRGGGRSPSWAGRPPRSHARCLDGQRQRNGRLLRRLAGTHEAVAGRPAGRPLLGRRTGLLRAARRTLRRHRSRAGALARLHFDHAALPFSVASPKTESAPESPARAAAEPTALWNRLPSLRIGSSYHALFNFWVVFSVYLAFLRVYDLHPSSFLRTVLLLLLV